MKKNLLISMMVIVLCMAISTVCFAAENDYVKREQVNTLCTGVQGEKVEFIGEERQSTGTLNLQIKNHKTGNIDLNLQYEQQRLGLGFGSRYLIDRVNISKKSFWIVKAYDDGPRYNQTNKIWVIGEYGNKYIVFLTEEVLGAVNGVNAHFGTVQTGPERGGESPAKAAIIFSTEYGNNEQNIAAYWDNNANWFGYSPVSNLPYGASKYQYGRWSNIRK